MASATLTSIHSLCCCDLPNFSLKDASLFQFIPPSHFKFYSGLKSKRRCQGLRAQATRTVSAYVASSCRLANVKNKPDHLLILVHGLMGSPGDWTYAKAELNRCLGKGFLIHESSSNATSKTLDGIDCAGRRLADEVMQVVQKSNSLKRISFLAHSLGGVIARYAISVLYSSNVVYGGHSIDPLSHPTINSERVSARSRAKIAGLEPINFITLASPHLGVRGRKQLPFLLGIPILEHLAPSLAPIFSGQTGTEMFLTDNKSHKAPLRLRMASDCEDGKFMSALGAFKYHMVGWRTSSIRRATELPKLSCKYFDDYKHVVNVEYCPPISSDSSRFSAQAAMAKEIAQAAPSAENTFKYHEFMEEEMICGLQQIGWRKVDINFHSAFLPFLAHNNIAVKNECLYHAGKGVIAHVVDSIKQEESSSFLDSRL